MSPSYNTSDRSGIWSYVPFGSSPRRRSVSSGLPLRHSGNSDSKDHNAPWDPFEKSDRRTGGNGASHPSTLESIQNAWMTQSRQARYLKTGGVLTLIVLLYWVFSGGSSYSASNNVYTPDNSPTTRCTKPHDLSKPLVQYAIMIDAGSTGSRIHVYKFNNCGPTPELEHEEFKMTEKKSEGSGLSSYKTDAEGAAKSLDPLMEVALSTVPDDYKSCTPVAVKATAGLRLLGDEMSAKILNAVRTRLETKYPFPVVSKEKGGVEIMKGEDEGVFAWITTNYLLGKIGGPDETPTAAILDLGGGSTQIVFQPTFKNSPHGGMPEKMAEGDHKYNLKFGGRDFELYQHSHLGYGLMSARNALHASVLDHMHKQNPNSKAWLSKPIPNSCIIPGMQKKINVTMPPDHELAGERSVTMEGPVDAIPAQCRALAEGILYKDKACTLHPCSFNGVHQPSLDKTFSREDVYIFSYFYDRTHDLGMPESFTLRELLDLTEKVCGGEKHWNAFEGVEGALTELRDRPEWCLDLNFMSALLHTGYEMPIDREVKIAKKIKGNELGWCLGASLPLLEKESGWECRIKEVTR
ncbi:guanosine-diphosphatase [Capronia coronata CBS 617.96]|uniref:guanosine-diphosphatase n=1 Tax=Capronia coronata CBS 617.96 TaxID=1182541 RepID=W9XR75_9EURO|nr:guanosine-diphosphatase [Capronia coronata CBS 617.96]EXJ79471.1 guanosine-diphosphatase [Capronia coronata CBS 617.96]